MKPGDERSVAFPKDWVEDNPVPLTVMVVGHDGRSGDRIWVGGGVLENGTNLLALRWPHGTNFMRCLEETGWAIEEKIDPKQPPVVKEMWRHTVNAIVNELRSRTEVDDDPEAI